MNDRIGFFVFPEPLTPVPIAAVSPDSTAVPSKVWTTLVVNRAQRFCGAAWTGVQAQAETRQRPIETRQMIDIIDRSFLKADA